MTQISWGICPDADQLGHLPRCLWFSYGVAQILSLSSLQVIRGLEFVRCCTTQLIDNSLVVFIVTDLPTSQLESIDDSFMRERNREETTTIKTAVIDRIRCQLPSHYTPDDVVVIDNLPVTKHGKLGSGFGVVKLLCSTQLIMKFVLLINEPRHEKTNILHMRKQRRRSVPLFSLHR